MPGELGLILKAGERKRKSYPINIRLSLRVRVSRWCRSRLWKAGLPEERAVESVSIIALPFVTYFPSTFGRGRPTMGVEDEGSSTTTSAAPSADAGAMHIDGQEPSVRLSAAPSLASPLPSRSPSSSAASPPLAASPTSPSSAAAPSSANAPAGSRAPVFALEEAPTFYPTDAEFVNPLKYIASIRHIGERAGICKIVPPPSWRAPFSLDQDVLFFLLFFPSFFLFLSSFPL